MAIAVAGQFVSRRHDCLDQRRIAFADPAQREERGLHAVGFEQLKEAREIALDATGLGAPAAARQIGIEGRHLKPVFDIDAERIAHAGRRRRSGLSHVASGS